MRNISLIFVSTKTKITQTNMKRQVNEIRKLLRRGDPAMLAKITGYSVRGIRGMLSGERTMHPLVREAAEKLIESRRKRIDSAIETEANRINP